METHVILLAGGMGSRFGTSVPKQFVKVDDVPIIIYTLRRLQLDSVADITIVCLREWIESVEKMITDYGISKVINVVPGGESAFESTKIGIKSLEKIAIDNDIILIHDAVRPFVTLRMIEENIELVQKTGAVDTVVPATDTIVESLDGKLISAIPNRKVMYQGQTPQSFKLSLLKELYLSLTEEEKGILTDACKICVIRNYPVSLAEGSDTNIKITTPGDLKIAQAMVGGLVLD